MTFNFRTIQAPGRRHELDVQMPFDAAKPESYFKRNPANFGDFFVGDSMVRLVDGTFHGNLQFPASAESDLPKFDPDGIDALVLRGANYIRNNLDLSGLGKLIETAGKRCIVMGIGAQAADFEPLDLSKGTIRALKILGDHCETVGTRGTYTAEVLTDIGVKNVEPVGCPTLFRHRNRDLAIQFDSTRVRRVGFNMNRHMRGIYGSSTVVTNRMQRSILRSLFDRFDVDVFCQGEPAEFIGAFDLDKRLQMLRNDLLATGLADDASDPMIEQFSSAAVCCTSIADWERLARNVDAMIGMRFHGNSVALAQAIPSVYLVNDTRVHELAQYFQVPYFDLRDAEAPPVAEGLLHAADFTAFNSGYAERYDRFKWYLEHNGFPHRMGEGSGNRGNPTYQDLKLNHLVATEPAGAWSRKQLEWMSDRMDRLDRQVRTLKRNQAG